MADWTTLPNTAVGVGGLPSGTTVTALRDNPIAIAEGAAGAPKIASHVFGARGPTLSFTDLDDFQGCWLFVRLQDSNLRTLSIAYSTDNGASYSASTSLGGLQPFEGRLVFFDFSSGDVYDPASDPVIVNLSGASSAINAIRISSTANIGVTCIPQGGKAP